MYVLSVESDNILRGESTQLHVEIDSTLHYKYSMQTRENETLYTYPFGKKQGSRQTILGYIQKNKMRMGESNRICLY